MSPVQWDVTADEGSLFTWHLFFADDFPAEGVAFISCDSVNTFPVHAAVAAVMCAVI